MTWRLAALAAAGVVGLATPVVIAAPPAAAQPTHVAVVVAGVGEACVPAGGDGLETLSAKFDVVYGQPPHYAGFVLTIDGKGTQNPDNTHYWSYWHNTGSGWRYSSTGGAGYYPPAGSVEGWSYVDGQTSASPPPPRSYAQVCAGSDPAPAPRTSAPRTSAPRTTTTAHTSAPNPPASRAYKPGTTASRSAAVSAASAGQAASGTSTASRHAPSSSTSTPAPSASLGTMPASSPVAHAGGRSAGSGMPPWGTLAGLGGVLLLGGAGYWLTRRRAHP